MSLGLGVLPYLTFRKLSNLVRCEAEKLRRSAQPSSFPVTAVIDVNSRCNLQCPYCPTGARRDSGRVQSLIDPSIVQQLVDELGQYLISAHLFNWGEPLLHPQIGEMVNMFSFASHIHCNIEQSKIPLERRFWKTFAMPGLITWL